MTNEKQTVVVEKLAKMSHEKFGEVLELLNEEGVLKKSTPEVEKMWTVMRAPYEALPEAQKNGSRAEALGVLNYLRQIGAVS